MEQFNDNCRHYTNLQSIRSGSATSVETPESVVLINHKNAHPRCGICHRGVMHNLLRILKMNIAFYLTEQSESLFY